MRSPSQQVGKGQPGATEPIVEPDTEVEQGYPRGQSSSQTLKLVGSLSPEAKSVEQLIVDAFDDLTESGHPSPQAFGPGFLGVALGWMDHLRAVAIEPAPMVFGALEALVGHIGHAGRRTGTWQPRVRLCPYGKECLRQWLVGTRGRTKAKACDHAGRLYGDQKGEPLVPAQAVGPADVGPSGKPAMSAALCVANGHRRGVQGLVWRLGVLRDPRQVQGHLLNGLGIEAHEAVELGAIGQVRECISE